VTEPPIQEYNAESLTDFPFKKGC